MTEQKGNNINPPRTVAEMRWALGNELGQLRNRHMKAQRTLQALGREPTIIELLDLVLADSPFRDAVAEAINNAGPPKPYEGSVPDASIMAVVGLLELAFVAQVMLTCTELTDYRIVCASMMASINLESGMSLGIGAAPHPDGVGELLSQHGIAPDLVVVIPR